MLVQAHDSPRPFKSLPNRKRRKLDTSATAKVMECRRPSITINAPDREARPNHSQSASCVSCHRALSSATDATHASGTVLCSLCHSPACLICSRKCTAAPPLLSSPPTPRLSNTPTPPITPIPSPRRHLLGLTPSNINLNVEMLSLPAKERRRKDRTEADDAEGGCGRTLCRSCCIESDVTHAVTCLDCYGVSPYAVSHSTTLGA